jgi:glucosylceramidase
VSLGAAALAVGALVAAGPAAYNAEYYVLGQASKFVKPGAVRIDSNTFGSGNIEDVAFKNPDGSTALIVLNADTSSANRFNVAENGQSFTYSLPAKAVATFTWPALSSGGGGGSGISSSAWYQVANTNSGKCVDDTNGSAGNGTPIQLWAYGGGTNQQWKPALQPDGTYTFTARNSGAECLDVTNRSTANGTQLQQWACTSGDPAQTFTLTPQS